MRSGDVDELPMKMSGCGLVPFGTERLVLFGGYGLPSTTKVSSKPCGQKVTLVTTSRKGTPSACNSQSTQSSVEEAGVKLLGVKPPVVNGDITLLSSGDGGEESNDGGEERDDGDGGGGKALVNGKKEANGEEMNKEGEGTEIVENEGKEDGEEEETKKGELEGTMAEVVENKGKMGEDDEDDEDDEDEEPEVSALIDKRWTNELKVYDLQNGMISHRDAWL